MMNSILRVFIAAAIIAMTGSFAACGENPSSATATSAGVLLSGGATFGSGSRVIPEDEGEITAAADSASTDQSSGVGFGSGN